MKSIGIIGGGVIGLCCAYYLQKEGCEVTVFDEGSLESGCSWLNAGMIVPSHIVPLAAPGVIVKGLRWMLNKESPFAIHLRKDKAMLHWLRLFYQSANRNNVAKAIPYLRDISLLSKALYRELADAEGFDFGYAEKGLFMLYQSAAAERAERETVILANHAGIQARVLAVDEIQSMESEVPPNVKGGIYFPGDAHLDPGAFMHNMIGHLKKSQVKLIANTSVTGFSLTGEKLNGILTSEAQYPFDEVVISCGSRSGDLLKKLHVSLPLMGGKGYSFTLEGLKKNIRIPSLLIEGRVAVTPVGNGRLRVGGTMVIGEDNSHISPRRVNGILNTLHTFYPELSHATINLDQVSSGQRPCSPDGLPYIGRMAGYPNLTVATGHGMMGMSLGPATGKLVSEIMMEKQSGMDMQAFGPERFS